MTKGWFVAYYRVSPDRQGRSGVGLEAQQEAVRRHLNGGSCEIIAEVTARFMDVRHPGSPHGLEVRQKKADLLPVIRELQGAGMTAAAFARELTRRRTPTPRGKQS